MHLRGKVSEEVVVRLVHKVHVGVKSPIAAVPVVMGPLSVTRRSFGVSVLTIADTMVSSTVLVAVMAA